MICCDSCEDWFHGKCVNITKAMGQQMEDDGIEWTCPNCIKKRDASANKTPKPSPQVCADNFHIITIRKFRNVHYLFYNFFNYTSPVKIFEIWH